MPYLTIMFNNILKDRIVSDELKSGILTPVIKKNKDPTDFYNYRGITVKPVIGKVHEYCILDKLNLQNSSDLQFGFTKGLCPLIASLLITESKCEKSIPVILSTVDVQSAFDVVQHTILFDKLLDQNIHPDLWLLVKNIYEGLTSKVKWMGKLSDSFNIKQGVRQGGLLSSVFYKIFIQDLLDELERNSIGLHLGDIYVGTPTCADDLALLSSSEDETQLMLNVVHRYSQQHFYNLHPTKTNIVEFNKQNNIENSWKLDGKNLCTTRQTGI